MAANDDDLYGDLDDTVAKPITSSSNTSQTSRAPPTMPMTMMAPPEIAQLQQQIKSLKAENETLKKNIGILYRTAKSELERKDRTIDQLQNELDASRR
mmetsp:Transcript_30001/g.51044  ORF Transcript_30001/g.51044 Transcript_30001/m.51044 type:complete len:98 (-) Transcript_30001:75-368(-)|eukprot:CAMPEP_0183727030 /NCGR_PEP_ID=MMETSP0737-20130205/24644_1 /TAXON_ID=385413 /ORGANISM="Thalassiosira miniscula, Strain CCMP1093" /LENGTH=97 /DNA_ID=CAMNT_0025958547 /DNA_START=39 /DNA_END=332 /DNA_ORIENTATION=-